ncbi:MAG: DNA-binding protein [Rhodospirillales bacterium]|nr:MAG: DNA-binding protein [Rhodospirillales bacterium]
MTQLRAGAIPPEGGALPGANLADDLLRGADAIADFMGMKRRQIYHLTETSRLPVFRVGSVLCARRSTLLGWVEDQERRATAGCGQ